MASSSDKRDVSDMFQKMGEKLGWFKHNDLDMAVKSVSIYLDRSPQNSFETYRPKI